MNKLTLVNKNKYVSGYEYVLFRDKLDFSVFDNINEIKVFNSDINIINFVKNNFCPKINLVTNDYVIYNLERNIYNVIFTHQDNSMRYKLTEKTINKIGYFGFIFETKEKEYRIELEENIYYETIVMLNSLIFDIYVPSNYLDMCIENRHIAKYIDAKTINDYLVIGKLKLKDVVENCSLSYVLENVTNIDTLIELYIMCFRNLTGTPFHDALVASYNEFDMNVATFSEIYGFEINKRTNIENLIIKREDQYVIITNKVTKNSATIKDDNVMDYESGTTYCNEMLKNDIILIDEYHLVDIVHLNPQLHYHSTRETKGYDDSYQITDTCFLYKYYQIKDNSLVQLISHCWSNNIINKCQGWIVIPELLIFDPSNYFQYNIVKQKFFKIDFTVIPYKIDKDILNTIRKKIIRCNL